MSLKNSKRILLTTLLSAMFAGTLCSCGTDSLNGDWKKEKSPTPEAASINIEAETQAVTESTTTKISEGTTAAATEATTEASSVDSKTDENKSVETTPDEEKSAGSESAEDKSSDSMTGTDYSVCSNFDEETVESFAAAVQLAVANEEWADLAELIEYPITIDDIEYNDTESFLKAVDGFGVSHEFKEAILETDTRELFARDIGIMMGNGEIWINDRQDGSNLGITSLNFFFSQHDKQ